MKSLAKREFRRILIIKPSSMGDVLHAVPVLWGLRRRYPEAWISWLIGDAFAPLIADHPALDEIIRFDRQRFGRVGRSIGVTRDFIRFAAELRRKRFDLIVDLQGLFRSGFLSLASGSSVRVGLSGARELAGLFYTHRVSVPRGDVHAVDRVYCAARALGCDADGIDLTIPVGDEARRSLRSRLEALGLGAEEPFLAVAPGARWDTKRWLAGSFARAIDLVHERTGARAVVLGSGSEKDLCAVVASGALSRPVNLAGQTTHEELIAAVDGSEVLLCNDSGTKDVAVALGRPVVTVFGPTHAARTGPYGRERDVVRADLACSPCYLRKLSQCPYDLECMRKVSAETVVERIMDHWGRSSRYDGTVSGESNEVTGTVVSGGGSTSQAPIRGARSA